MSVADLLAEVEALGGTEDQEAVEYKLIVDVPDDFPASVIERLRVNKRAIIQHLSPSTALNDAKHLRELWANAGLSLAESVDWEPVEYKRAFKVVAGQHGWRLFCAKANLTMLRDQVFPTLVRELKPDEPPDQLPTQATR